MSSNGYPPPFVPRTTSPETFSGGFIEALAATRARPHRYWLHVLLLLATFLTTTVVGAGMALSFRMNLPVSFLLEMSGYERMLRDPAYLLSGLPFSLSLLTILMAHEMGHYLAARYYTVDATLPFFLPAPTLIGTLGAFIRLRSAIVSKRILFDIGIAGPIAGFAALLVPLAIGVSMSHQMPRVALRGDFVFGTPLLLRIFEMMWFPGVSTADLSLHPMARAAWAGLLATALNLLPIGQLDGGHILYAIVGERAKWLSRILVAALAVMGFFFAYSWLLWAVLLVLFGLRHPPLYDPYPIGRARIWLGLLALAILVVSFTPIPVRTPELP